MTLEAPSWSISLLQAQNPGKATSWRGTRPPLQDVSPSKAANVPEECELTMQIMILRECDQYKRTHIRQSRNKTYYLPKKT